jgi:molybdenum cofactor cytidylyltransferase
MNARVLNYGVLILAAGASSRMGQPKLLLPWNDTTILGHLISQWLELGAKQVAVVCRANHRELHQELDRVGFPAQGRIINPKAEEGMFSSIRCGAAWTGWHDDLTHFIIVLGDQPHVRRETLGELLRFAAIQPEMICQPAFQGRTRHPVVLPRREFGQLRNRAGSDENLKTFLGRQSGRLASLEIKDPGLNLDIDRPEDYARARQMTEPGGE